MFGGCWLLVIGLWLLVFGCLLLVDYWLLFSVCCVVLCVYGLLCVVDG